MSRAQRERIWRLERIYPILARLPLALAYRLADVLGRRDARHHRDLRIALRNGFTRVWPELLPAALEQLIAAHARMHAREVLDAFLLDRLSAPQLAGMVAIRGLEQLRNAQAQGRGVLLAMAHHSRLVLFLAALGAVGVRMGMLTMRINESNPELLPAERRYLARKVAGLQARIGGRWLSLGQSMRPLYDGLARGETWIVLFDAHHPDFGKRRAHPFLGGRLNLSIGLERIMARTGARMVYAGVRECGPMRLEGRLVRLPDNPAEAMQRAVVELEHDVIRDPAQWWHWNILDYIWSAAHGDGAPC